MGNEIYMIQELQRQTQINEGIYHEIRQIREMLQELLEDDEEDEKETNKEENDLFYEEPDITEKRKIKRKPE